MLTASLLALASGAADAQTNDRWEFEVTPYLWAAGMQGDVGVGKLSAQGVEASFSDVLSSLRFGFMGALEGRRDRFGFVVDAMYLQLSQTRPAPRNFLGDVHATPTQQSYSVAATWRAIDGEVPLDLVAGIRSNDVKLDLDLSSSVLAPNGRTANQSRGWVDGIVGARVAYPIAPGWRLVGYVDLGGGGSDFTWQGLAGLNYAISEKTTVKFGYRYLKVDYDRDNFVYDMATSGFYFGVGMRF